MAIDITRKDDRVLLQEAVEYHDTNLEQSRQNRQAMVSLFRGEEELDNTVRSIIGDETDPRIFINMIQQFAKGQILALAGRNPRWQCDARMVALRGVDKKIQNFLNAYTPVIGIPRVFQQLALDSVFGVFGAKITSGPPPKGIFSPYVPRAYRLNPDALIYDQTSPTWEEVMFVGDSYLMSLREARQNPNFDPAMASRIMRWGPSQSGGPDRDTNYEAYAEEMTRLFDVYIPSAGQLVTFTANDSCYSDIIDGPLMVQEVKFCPYEVNCLISDPDSVRPLSSLDSLHHFHVLANTMIEMTARQATQSKRNPVGKTGAENDLSTLIDTPDGDPVLVDNLEDIGFYQIPGPDPSLAGTANLAMSLFSKFGGNLEVALGQGVGAETARQTQALIQQVSSMQQLDRAKFEEVQASIGYKLASLAFENEDFQFEGIETIPGTEVGIPAEWPPAEFSRSTMKVDQFLFSIVPFSSQFRTPQDKVAQLTEASVQIIQLMQATLAGAPLNMEVILQDYAEAYDEIPKLQEWWSGQTPTPPGPGGAERPAPASINTGSDIRYRPGMGGSQADPFGLGDIGAAAGGQQNTPPQGGLTPLGGLQQ